MDIPSLFMIPSAVSSGKVHSVFPNSTDADFDFNRDSSATRVNSQGLIETVGYYGSELVTNRTFDTDSNWTKGTGWTISDGKANVNATNFTDLYQTIGTVAGKTYKISFEVSNYVSGSVKLILGYGSTPELPVLTATANGVYEVETTPNTTNPHVVYISTKTATTNLSIDNVSVKEVTGDRARLNYEIEGGLVNTKPSLLLEPQSTNSLTYSNDFANSYWTKSGTSISSNAFVSPDGTLNAYKLVEDTSNGSHICFNQQTGASKTFSFFAKSSGNQYVAISYDGGANFTFFDILNGQLGTVADSSRTSKIENYGNGWFRCSMYNGHNTYGATIWMSKDGATVSYQGDGSSGVYIYGAQLEQQSYPTSYIPTNGSTQTRAAETCNGAGTSSILPSEEGILYAEIAALSDSISTTVYSISDGSANNTLYVGFNATTNTVLAQLIVGGVAINNMSSSVSDRTDFNKIAVLYKNNNHKLFINGVQVATDTSGATPSAGTFDRVNFDFGQGSFDFYGKIRDIRVYNTKEMTDSEVDILLTKITS